jgi:hypothetical protein
MTLLMNDNQATRFVRVVMRIQEDTCTRDPRLSR